MKTNVRNSNFELLRIVAMFMIVTYHIIAKTTLGEYTQIPFLISAAMPLHVGVICFLLITGYFNVDLSLKKITRLVVQTIFYSVLVYVCYSLIIKDFSLLRFGASFIPVCLNPDLWFIRTYLLFLLCTPVINYWLRNTSKKNRFLTLLGLTFMSVYIGCFGNDNSFQDGKNVINFCLIYVIGNELRKLEYIKQIKKSSLLYSYVALNVIICIATYYSTNTSFFSIIKKMAWYYDSPFLIMNATLLFLIFEKMNFKSIQLNKIASSVFPVYLIHANLYTGRVVWPFVNTFIEPDYNFLTILLFAFVIMLICIALDKILAPLYNNLIDLVYNRISSIKAISRYSN